MIVGWILWSASVWAAAPVVPGDPLPRIHLIRVNDPLGLSGFDLTCEAPGPDPENEPPCQLTEVRGSKTAQRTLLSLERAQSMAEEFLARLPREEVAAAPKKEAKPLEPPKDALLIWNVSLGERAARGFLKKNAKGEERKPQVLKAVLRLESDLGQPE